MKHDLQEPGPSRPAKRMMCMVAPSSGAENTVRLQSSIASMAVTASCVVSGVASTPAAGSADRQADRDPVNNVPLEIAPAACSDVKVEISGGVHHVLIDETPRHQGRHEDAAMGSPWQQQDHEVRDDAAVGDALDQEFSVPQQRQHLDEQQKATAASPQTDGFDASGAVAASANDDILQSSLELDVSGQETVAKEPAVAASILEMQAVVQHDHPVLLDIAYVVTDPQTGAEAHYDPVQISMPPDSSIRELKDKIQQTPICNQFFAAGTQRLSLLLPGSGYESLEEQTESGMHRTLASYHLVAKPCGQEPHRVYMRVTREAGTDPGVIQNVADGEAEVSRKPRREHNRWNDEEVEKLLTGVECIGVGSWRQLKNESFDNRTDVDLKDKWRNIVKAVKHNKKPRGMTMTPEMRSRVLRCDAMYEARQVDREAARASRGSAASSQSLKPSDIASGGLAAAVQSPVPLHIMSESSTAAVQSPDPLDILSGVHVAAVQSPDLLDAASMLLHADMSGAARTTVLPQQDVAAIQLDVHAIGQDEVSLPFEETADPREQLTSSGILLTSQLTDNTDEDPSTVSL